MPNLNKVFLMGHLTRDPDLRFTPAGLGIATFGLAVNTLMGKDDDGNRKEETLFVDVVAFGKQAETITEYLKKGSPIFLEGRLRLRSWEDANGVKHSKHEVVLSGFQFLSSSKGSGSNSSEDTSVGDDIPF